MTQPAAPHIPTEPVHKANDPNLAGWFSKTFGSEEDDKKSKQDDKKRDDDDK